MTYRLSKSRIAAFEQCPRKLWLMTHAPHLAEPQEGAAERFAVGHAVGAEACEQCPGGMMVEAVPDLSAALATTSALLASGHRKPIFKATFQHEGVLVRCDILEPVEEDGWHLVEVKSATKAKPEHLRDIATQVWVARGAGLRVVRASIRHLDSDFVLSRAGDYGGFGLPWKNWSNSGESPAGRENWRLVWDVSGLRRSRSLRSCVRWMCWLGGDRQRSRLAGRSASRSRRYIGGARNTAA